VRRPATTQGDDIVNLVGDVKGKNVLIVEDVVDSGRSMKRAARACKDAGTSVVCILSSVCLEYLCDVVEQFYTDTKEALKLTITQKWKQNSCTGEYKCSTLNVPAFMLGISN
jgi:phosphoribosylpyrophosphate synthetase